MPVTTPSPIITPEAIRRLLMQGGDPSSMLAPDPSQSPASAPGTPGATPSTTGPPSVPPSAPPSGSLAQSLQAPEDKGQYLTEHPVAMPARPRGDFDKIPDGQPGADTWGNRHNVLRSVLASLFSGAAEFGGELNHHPGASAPFINRWAGQQDAQRQYDQTQPVLKQNAENASYDQYLGQGAKAADIEHQQQDTENLRENSPAMQRKAQFLTQLQGDAESGKYDPVALKAKYLRIAQFNRVNVAPEEIETAITGTKPLGSKYSLTRDPGTQAPIELVDRQGNHYSASNLPKDPEAQQMWNDASTAATNKVTTEENKEKRVAGYAADRQATAFGNQQKMEETKKVQPRIDTALDSDQRLSRMEGAYEKAKKGDQQAMLSLLTDHIGMTLGMQKGARITKDILNEAAQSQPWLSKITSKFDERGYLSGVTLGPEQMKQMLSLGYEARDRAFDGAHEAATAYGQPLPEGFVKVESKRTSGSKPALDADHGGGDVIYARDPQGKLHKAAKGTALPQGWKTENAPATK